VAAPVGKSTGRALPSKPRGDAPSRWERRLARLGYRAVAGVDEAGRGSWAGPLVAAAVILPAPTRRVVEGLRGVRDSKQITRSGRERLYAQISRYACGIGVGLVSPATIDGLGLGRAGRLAMERAVWALAIRPDYLLIDAFRLPTIDCPQEGIIYGDSLCLSIAAASIIAKVERDRILDGIAGLYPAFGFERNRGYGTAEHGRALGQLGPTPVHRYSYAPVRAVLNSGRLC